MIKKKRFPLHHNFPSSTGASYFFPENFTIFFNSHAHALKTILAPQNNYCLKDGTALIYPFSPLSHFKRHFQYGLVKARVCVSILGEIFFEVVRGCVYIKWGEGGLNYWQQGRLPGIDALSIHFLISQPPQKRLLLLRKSRRARSILNRAWRGLTQIHPHARSERECESEREKSKRRVACATNKPALYIFILFAQSHISYCQLWE